MKAPTLKSQQDLVDKINSTYQVGDKIKVRQDNDEVVEWTMKYKASILGGHTAVIWCEEHSSCYQASRVVFK